MRSIILTITLAVIVSLAGKAQSNTVDSTWIKTGQVAGKIRFSVALDQGIPVGYVSRYASYVASGSVQAEYMVLKELGVSLNAGYLYFLGKDGEAGLPLLPGMGGINFYITPKVFINGQLGVSFYMGDENYGEKKAYLTYAQGVGYRLSNRISLSARYSGVNVGVARTYSFAGMRIAYTIGKL